jgi:hypothetical protein
MVFIGEDLRRLTTLNVKHSAQCECFDSANDLQDEKALGLDFLMIDYMKVRNEPGYLLFAAPVVNKLCRLK